MPGMIPWLFGTDVPWPGLEAEIGEYRSFLTGNVLNAGAGNRDISSIVSGRLYNQDLAQGEHNGRIDFHSPLHEIPVANGFFDTVFCNAVLEHVANPAEVVAEFARVLKPGGHLYLCVPFMQPEHLDPTDFQRYTRDGLARLVTDAGFEVLKAEGVHSVYHTLSWVIAEWARAESPAARFALRALLLPWVRHRARHSRRFVHPLASAYRVLARRR